MGMLYISVDEEVHKKIRHIFVDTDFTMSQIGENLIKEGLKVIEKESEVYWKLENTKIQKSEVEDDKDGNA